MTPAPDSPLVSASVPCVALSASISFSSLLRTKSAGCAVIFSLLLHAISKGHRRRCTAGCDKTSKRCSATARLCVVKSTASTTKTIASAPGAYRSSLARSRGCPGRSTSRTRLDLPSFVDRTSVRVSFTSMEVTVLSRNTWLDRSVWNIAVLPPPHAPTKSTQSPLPSALDDDPPPTPPNPRHLVSIQNTNRVKSAIAAAIRLTGWPVASPIASRIP